MESKDPHSDLTTSTYSCSSLFNFNFDDQHTEHIELFVTFQFLLLFHSLASNLRNLTDLILRYDLFQTAEFGKKNKTTGSQLHHTRRSVEIQKENGTIHIFIPKQIWKQFGQAEVFMSQRVCDQECLLGSDTKCVQNRLVRDCPEFRPTSEEFKNFAKYIESIEQKALPFGIMKIIPPDGESNIISWVLQNWISFYPVADQTVKTIFRLESQDDTLRSS